MSAMPKRGMGAKMAGGNAAVPRNRAGLYPTPENVTRALYRRWRRLLDGSTLWEPMAGNSAMSNVLRNPGMGYTGARKVVETDIDPQSPSVVKADFFAVKRLPNVFGIVTNPPFPLAARIIEHAFTLPAEHPLEFMALYLKGSYWHAEGRYKLFKRFQPSHIHPLLWRPDFDGSGNPTMEAMWCVWDRSRANQAWTEYEPLERPE